MATIIDRYFDDYIYQQIKVLQAAEGLSGRILKELEEAENEILRFLIGRRITSFTRTRMIELLNQVRRISSEFGGKAYQHTKTDGTEIAKIISKKTSGDLNSAFRINIFTPTISANQIKTILDDHAILGGMTLKDFWARQAIDIVLAYSRIIRTGLITGKSYGDIVKQVMEEDVLRRSKANVRTLVRTSIMETANQTRMEVYKQQSHLIKGIQWLSTLDSRTSDICRKLDLKKWEFPNFKPIEHDYPYPGPTAHPNCRSTQLPVIRSFADLATKNKDLAAKLDKALEEVSGVRASQFGPVSGNLTYDQWLKNQPEKVQKELLKSKWKEWSEGKVPETELVEQSIKPITVNQLREAFDPKWKTDSYYLQEEMGQYLSKLEQEVMPTLTDDEHRSLRAYTGTAFEQINTLLRTSTVAPYLYEQASAHIENIKSAFNNRAPRNEDELRLWRFTSADQSHEIGDIVTDKGFFSTSAQHLSASMFGTVGYDIRVPPGVTPVLPGHILEREIILPHNTSFRIVGKRQERHPMVAQSHDITIYEIEILPWK